MLRLRDSTAPSGLWAKTTPTAPVAVAKCATYGPEVGTTLATLFDQLGGIDKLVRGKTVAIKINVTGSPPMFFHDLPMDGPTGFIPRSSAP